MAPLIPIAISLAAKYVPEIIRHFKGDAAGDVAGKVIDIAQTVTGTKTPEEADAVMQADPAKALEFKIKVMENESSLIQMHLADVQSARGRDVELAKAGFRNNRADVMLGLTFIGLVALVSVMLFRDIDANSALGGIVILLIGKLIAQWETGFNFEFGTTRGSKDKDATITRLTGS